MTPTQMSALSSNDLLFKVENEIAQITFNRPHARNAFTFDMYRGVLNIAGKLIAEHNQGQSKIRAVVLTGAGDKAFAAGTDIAGFRDFSTADDALNYEKLMDDVIGTFEKIPIPTIAAIRGACTGGGAAIAAACDLRISSEDIKYGFPIARTLGNCLSNANLSRLVYLLGAARTREIIFTSRLILKDEALQIGLVSEIVPDPLQHALSLAEKLKGHAPLTMQATKEALRRLREQAANVNDADLIVQCYTSHDFHEGLEAFLAKRKPEWQGR